MSNPFVVGNTYNFSTYAPAILGSAHNNMRVKAVFGYEMAVTFSQPDVKHSAIYPYLVAESLVIPDDPKSYTYVMFGTTAGVDVVMAIEWVKLDTVEAVVSQKLIIEIPDTKPGDAAYYRDVLLQAGAKNITIR